MCVCVRLCLSRSLSHSLHERMCVRVARDLEMSREVCGLHRGWGETERACVWRGVCVWNVQIYVRVYARVRGRRMRVRACRYMSAMRLIVWVKHAGRACTCASGSMCVRTVCVCLPTFREGERCLSACLQRKRGRRRINLGAQCMGE